jgi:hypothetical protein
MRADGTPEWTPLARQLSRQAAAVPCPEHAATTLGFVAVAGCLQIATKIRPSHGHGLDFQRSMRLSLPDSLRFKEALATGGSVASEWPQGRPAVSPYRSGLFLTSKSTRADLPGRHDPSGSAVARRYWFLKSLKPVRIAFKSSGGTKITARFRLLSSAFSRAESQRLELDPGHDWRGFGRHQVTGQYQDNFFAGKKATGKMCISRARGCCRADFAA